MIICILLGFLGPSNTKSPLQTQCPYRSGPARVPGEEEALIELWAHPSVSMPEKWRPSGVGSLRYPPWDGRGLFKGRDSSGSHLILHAQLVTLKHRSHADGVRSLWDSQNTAHNLINVTPVRLVGGSNDMYLVKLPFAISPLSLETSLFIC